MAGIIDNASYSPAASGSGQDYDEQGASRLSSLILRNCSLSSQGQKHGVCIVLRCRHITCNDGDILGNTIGQTSHNAGNMSPVTVAVLCVVISIHGVARHNARACHRNLRARSPDMPVVRCKMHQDTGGVAVHLMLLITLRPYDDPGHTFEAICLIGRRVLKLLMLASNSLQEIMASMGSGTAKKTL